MYFFDTEIYYHKDSPGFLCNFQGSIVASLCIAQVTILALIGIMMETIFNNPEEIETYSKTNKIIKHKIPKVIAIFLPILKALCLAS